MTLDLARWQFALTSINHFPFVPVTIGWSVPVPIGLAFLAALLQTGGIVGAPLAMAGLAAFFPGPTFPGRWLRGSGSGSAPAIPGRRRC